MVLVRFINNPKPLQLDDYRSMTGITLSPYWMPGEPRDNYWRKQHSFHYRKGEAAIFLISRTQPLPPDEAFALRDSMIGGPHSVLVDEWKSLAPIVGDQADAKQFALKTADVLDWNGKIVLMTEGTWNEFDFQSYNIFVDADSDGKFVEEIMYQAPRSEYKERMSEAMLALQSIDWKTKSRW